ncbi:LuxR C-terminal-related transcriptional regulator [Microbacterium sp. NPDC055683]
METTIPRTAVELLRAFGDVATAPLLGVAEKLSDGLRAMLPHRALVIFTEDCTGRPQKKAGDTGITEAVTIHEMADVRRRLRAGDAVRTAVIAGAERSVRAWEASTGAVLVLCDADPPADAAVDELVETVWETTALHIRQLVGHADPSQPVESRAVSAERVRVTTELTERHATDLESFLAVLRGRTIDDRRARTAVADLVADALVRTKTASDVLLTVSEEQVARAFRRLRADLRPLTQYGRLDIEFVEPPADGRALPGEVAHAARAIVRSAVLAMNDQDDITRVRVQWDCDGRNLLVNVRDDGRGGVDADAPALHIAQAKAASLGGAAELTRVPGWGSELDVRLPLDPPSPVDVAEWGLAPREDEVLRLLAQGRRNRQIAEALSLSENTVKFHLARVYRKLGVGTRAEAVALAVGAGLA